MNLKTKLILALTLALTHLCLEISPLIATDDPLSISWSQLTTERVVGLDWSPNGDYLVTGLYDTSEIIILDWQTGEIVERAAFPGPSATMVTEFTPEWSPDGHAIANAKGNVYLLDPETGQLRVLREPEGEFGYVDVEWSPDSDALAALNNSGYIDIVSLETGEILQTVDVAGGEMERAENSGFLYSVFDWSADGNFFAAPHPLRGVAGEDPVMAFWGRNGDILAAYTRETLTDTAPTSPCSARAYALVYTSSLQWANDSRTLAVSGIDSYGICRLNIDGTIDQNQISTALMDILRWSPDQRWLAATHRNIDYTCSVWLSIVAENYQTYQLEIDPEPCYINSLAWSLDSQHLAASTDNGIWIGTVAPSG